MPCKLIVSVCELKDRRQPPTASARGCWLLYYHPQFFWSSKILHAAQPHHQVLAPEDVGPNLPSTPIGWVQVQVRKLLEKHAEINFYFEFQY